LSPAVTCHGNSDSSPDSVLLSASLGTILFATKHFEPLIELGTVQGMLAVCLTPVKIDDSHLANLTIGVRILAAAVSDKVLQRVGFVSPAGDGLRDLLRFSQAVLPPQPGTRNGPS